MVNKLTRDYIVWKAFTNRTAQMEKRFVNMLKALNGKQEKEVLAKAKRVNLSSVTDKKSIEIKAISKFDLILTQIVFDKDKWSKIFAKTALPLYKAMAQQSGNAMMQSLNVGIDFNLSDKRVEDFIKKKTIKFAKDVNDTQSNKLNRVIKPILVRGGTVEAVRERIQIAINKAYVSSVRGTAPRSRMISQTEMNGVSNFANVEAMDQSGVVKFKSWITTKDIKVRETHVKAGRKYKRNHGIPLNDPFKVGQALLSSPGNIVGGSNVVKEIANCRCTAVPSPKGRKR